MAISTKIIKAKIKSVSNIKKITKAMEMVAASKMKKTVDRALSTRPYATLFLELLKNITKNNYYNHPFLVERQSGQILFIIISANKGLCGGFNVSVAKFFSKIIAGLEPADFELVTIGKRSENIARRLSKKPLASFIDISDKPEERDLKPVSSFIQDEFKTGRFKEVRIIYNGFISTLSYKALDRPLLPVTVGSVTRSIAELGEVAKNPAVETESLAQYLFEPGEEEVLDKILPLILDVLIYQAFLESLASEYSARMIAMKNASDNADNLVSELEIGYNQARQAAITQEIAEIVSGSNI